MDKLDIIGKKVKIYQTPTEFEGVATIKGIKHDTIIQDELLPDGKKHYSAYCQVEFVNEPGKVYFRWLTTQNIIEQNDKHFYEGDTCKNSIKGHVFFPERADNGETVWVCQSCGEQRGFCQHEVETDHIDWYSHGTGCPETTTFHYCPHCHEDLDLSWRDEEAEKALAAAAATKPDKSGYAEYLREFNATGIDTARD